MTGGMAAPLPMSNHTRERVTVAKLTLENFYSTLLTQHEEREMRWCPGELFHVASVHEPEQQMIYTILLVLYLKRLN